MTSVVLSGYLPLLLLSGVAILAKKLGTDQCFYGNSMQYTNAYGQHH